MTATGGKRAPRIAFIGCGAVARKHSARLRRVAPHVALSYASRSADKAAATCRELKGATFYESYQAAVESDKVDLVFITTPPHLHLEWTLAALQQGKDVIVEKPAFPRVEAFDRVEAACKTHGRHVYVAENYYYKPLTQLLRRLIAEQVVGEVLFVQVNATKQQRNDDWREDPIIAGGGALLEGGIHWVSLLANIGLTVESARAELPRPTRTPERSMLVTFRYREGAVGTLAHSWEVPATLGGLRLSKISGREGSITFESNGTLLLCNGRKRRIYLPGFRDIGGFAAMFRDIIAAWEAGREASFTLAHARRDLEWITQAYASAGHPLPTLAEQTVDEPEPAAPAPLNSETSASAPQKAAAHWTSERSI
jgi:predicted dehydrogenase